ncbi:2-methylcitrate dehydratase [Terrihabitans soli]|uniref:2-methylcitrate dehydratase n=1 Tax=Terrihabitans soli TaxID=708113 RepID=A0A6S6QQW0_9HYPH|nr:MmgE/PrpD family protein [Terrihabitans soli]BCJ89652.1 2-methylcitrate dehydratase [Terrihabitans soli]
MSASPTKVLAEFGLALDAKDIPQNVMDKAAESILDSVGVCIYAAKLSWSQPVIDYARLNGAGGASTILGTKYKASSPMAALANGALAHGFEMDNLRQPSMGVHAGSTIVPGLLSVADEIGASGRDVLAAFVAANEVMSRIGLASHNTAEKLGFHSPGLTGPFGGAVAAGRLLKLTPTQMINAFGIAGSLCSGLLAFSKAGNGGMVKRLHTGRASESGVLAAKLAAANFEGPNVILEGKYGLFEAFTRDPHMDKLVAGLGSDWETLKIAVKCYAAHVTAHTPVQTLEGLKNEHGFKGDDIAEIAVATNEKALSHHVIREAKDVATAQYSLPIALATASYRDPKDPASFLNDAHKDKGIMDLAQRVAVTLNEESHNNPWATKMRVVLKDGRSFEGKRTDFRGAPSNPMSTDELDAKFLQLTTGLVPDAKGLLKNLRELGKAADIRTVIAGTMP